jgi:hypothetical protein
MMAIVVRPMAIPAMIDSTGKPGTAGSTKGVVVELEDSVTVTVVSELVLDVSLNMLLSVELASVLVVLVVSTVLVSVELVVLEVTMLVLVALVAVELDAVVVVVPPPPPPPPVGGFSGSRWRIPASVPPVIGRPTAKPSSGPLT